MQSCYRLNALYVISLNVNNLNWNFPGMLWEMYLSQKLNAWTTHLFQSVLQRSADHMNHADALLYIAHIDMEYV